MQHEVNIPAKKRKCLILHKRCPFFSAEQTVRRWRSDGGSPQSDLGWLRSLTNHQHPWLARNVLSGQRNIDFKIECVHYFYSLLCTPLGQCEVWPKSVCPRHKHRPTEDLCLWRRPGQVRFSFLNPESFFCPGSQRNSTRQTQIKLETISSTWQTTPSTKIRRTLNRTQIHIWQRWGFGRKKKFDNKVV